MVDALMWWPRYSCYSSAGRWILFILVICNALHPSRTLIPKVQPHSHNASGPSPSTSLTAPTHTSTSPTHLHSHHNHYVVSPHPSPHHHHHDSHSHSHSHSYEPSKLILNETAILESHSPTPLSYLSHDRQLVVVDPSTGALAYNPDATKTYPAWLLIHAIGMSLAWFVVLPLALVTSRSRKPWPNIILRIAFLVLLVFSLISGAIYRSYTPKLYEGEKHSTHGWVLVLLGFVISISDLFSTWYHFKDSLIQKRFSGYHSIPIGDDNSENDLETSPSSPKYYHHSYEIQEKNSSLWPREDKLSYCKYFIERSIIVLASVAVIHGTVIYTGTCRAEYINGCLAHFIKGGIFFWYGVLNWIRYLGGFPELGWPWHRVKNKPKGTPSAEMVESCVVFLYGVTNVWMERFGVEPGDPYTVKQIQHISIAAMFAFGGLVGVLLETQAARSLLFGPQEMPTSNPFPTLCIAITGLTMSAHHQDYQFQVAIHTLWGVLLGLFGVMRWMTYALASEKKGPPVTEALGSLCLISGGIVFMQSVEEFTFAAIRHHFDDMMAFLNVTIAFVCLIMAWTMILMTIKRKMS